MNLSASSSAPSTASTGESRTSSGDTREPCDASACDAFALALQSRQQRQQQSGGDDEAETPAEPACLPPAPAWTLVHAPSYVPVAAAGAIEPGSRTQAAIETSLRDLPAPQAHPLATSEPTSTWVATLGGTLAVPVEVRATRADQPAPTGPQAAWTLSLSSSALGADVLARHAPRLSERLRKQAIEVDHVRVERRDTGESK